MHSHMRLPRKSNVAIKKKKKSPSRSRLGDIVQGLTTQSLSIYISEQNNSHIIFTVKLILFHIKL